MKGTRQALVLVTATLAVAGCSSAETKNDYVDTVNEIQTSALEAFNETATATPENKQALVEQLEAGEAALGDAVTRLEEVDVPEEAQDGHPDLIAGIDELRTLFAETAREVAESGTTAAFSAVSDLGTEGTRIGTRIDEVITRINQDLGAE